MRSSSVVVLALAAAAAAAPIKVDVEARQGAAGFSKILGNLASGAGILSSGINIGNFLGGLLGGDEAAAKRSLTQIEDHVTRELMAREVPELEARQGAAGFSKILGNVASGAGLLSSGINIGNFLGGLFGGDDAAAKRSLVEIEDLVTRELMAREYSDLEARQGAAGFSKILGNLASGAGILSGGINIGNFLGGLFGGDEAAAKRSLAQVEDHITRELMAREFSELEARQGAAGFSKILGNVASGAGLLSSGINIGNFLGGLFGGDDAAARREIMALGARELDTRQGLASIGKVGNNLLNLGSLGFSLGNIGDFVSGLISREEFEELAARELEARQGLASIGKVGNNLLNLGSLGFSLGNIGDFVSGLISRELGDEHYAREILEQELYRRAVADLD